MKKRDERGRFAPKCDDKYHKGYKVVYMPSHQRSRANGYVYEHILVAEKKLGRDLNSHEVVHHIDGDKLNNAPDNLEVFANNSEHISHHWKSASRKYTLQDGRKLSVAEMASLSGQPYDRVYQRITKLGWEPDRAMGG